MSKQGKFLGIPYDWRALTSQRFKSRVWNKKDHRLFTPRAFGWGYTINFYELFHNKMKFIAVVILVLILLGYIGIKEAIKTDKAHQTFENYYAFRGCSQLIIRTNDYGLCKLPSGKIIKLVKSHGKWYLEGDLPICIGMVCL